MSLRPCLALSIIMYLELPDTQNSVREIFICEVVTLVMATKARGQEICHCSD